MMHESAIVFVVDDEESARQSVVALVESMGLPAKCFASGEQFLEEYDDGPGCLVADMRMLGMSGSDLQNKLLERNFSLPVIIITAHADIPSAVSVMKLGAVSYLKKTGNEQDLWQAICDALCKDAAHRQALTQRRALQEKLDFLTTPERHVLRLISLGQINKQVAEALDVSQRTIENRRQAIMKKLDVKSFAELMRFSIKAEDSDLDSP